MGGGQTSGLFKNKVHPLVLHCECLLRTISCMVIMRALKVAAFFFLRLFLVNKLKNGGLSLFGLN